MNSRVIIHWARHAESCANVARKQIPPSPPSRHKGFEYIPKNENLPLDPLPNTDLDNSINALLSNESDWVVVKDDLENNNNIKNTDHENIFKKYLKYADYHILTSFNYEPNLSYIGIQQAILLGKNFVNCDYYDNFICSTMTRAMMTALFATRKCTDKKIIVSPFVSEKQKIPIDQSNIPNTCFILKKKLLFIKDWIEKNWVTKYDDIEIMSALKQIRDSVALINDNDKNNKNIIELVDSLLSKHFKALEDRPTLTVVDYIKKNNINPKIKEIVNQIDKIISNIRGQKFNFELFNDIENDTQLNKKLKGDPDADIFYNKLLPEIIKKYTSDDKKEYHFMVFSHGDFIKSIAKKYHNKDIHVMYNTQVVEQIIDYKDSVPTFVDIDTEKYNPQYIRKVYEDFEQFNNDICSTQSLKGIINYPLIDQTTIHKMKPTHQRIFDFASSSLGKPLDPKQGLSEDIQFYFDEKHKYENLQSQNELAGGYVKNKNNSHKKYQTRYLKLKK